MIKRLDVLDVRFGELLERCRKDFKLKCDLIEAIAEGDGVILNLSFDTDVIESLHTDSVIVLGSCFQDSVCYDMLVKGRKSDSDKKEL